MLACEWVLNIKNNLSARVKNLPRRISRWLSESQYSKASKKQDRQVIEILTHIYSKREGELVSKLKAHYSDVDIDLFEKYSFGDNAYVQRRNAPHSETKWELTQKGIHHLHDLRKEERKQRLTGITILATSILALGVLFDVFFKIKEAGLTWIDTGWGLLVFSVVSIFALITFFVGVLIITR